MSAPCQTLSLTSSSRPSGLDRLITATNSLTPSETRSFAYDAADNMVRNSGLCAATPNLVYPAQGATSGRPHAPATICGATVAYDAKAIPSAMIAMVQASRAHAHSSMIWKTDRLRSPRMVSQPSLPMAQMANVCRNPMAAPRPIISEEKGTHPFDSHLIRTLII
jgi:hypothetical protein